MRLTHLETCHLTEPIGYLLDPPVFSWTVTSTQAKKQAWAHVEVAKDPALTQIVFDTGPRADVSSLGTAAEMATEPNTRYFWRVTVQGDNGEQASAASFFETGKRDTPWRGRWIKAPFAPSVHPYLRKSFMVPGPVVSARLSICGLGLYEAEINGQPVGEDVLAPFYNDYNLWIQYQTYDVTGLVREGLNAIGAMLGNGWYRGRFGFGNSPDCLYGNDLQLLSELVVQTADGQTVTVATDSSWLCAPGPVLAGNIYDGEVFDARLAIDDGSEPSCAGDDFVPAIIADPPAGALSERLSPPLTIAERWTQATLIRTPKREQVIDFGQEMTGWVTFPCALPSGAKVKLSFGEILQDGCFYNENLRTAKQEFCYISDGKRRQVRPHFTYFGFRYMKVEGIEAVDPSQFTALVIHSAIRRTGTLETSNAKLNRLILNAEWGQRGNFLDVPTDCPQRDERMGWTGDAQVYCATASFNRCTPAFYRKYLHDMQLEQQQLSGNVPHVVPDAISLALRKMGRDPGHSHAGSCAWADAATVIPWTMYLFYGDKTLLAQQYANMRAWTEYLLRDDDAHGSPRLRTWGFHFADWLALDNPDKGSSFGGSDETYIASAYYFLSATLTAKAARVLGKKTDAGRYDALADQIRAAMRQEYFTPTGRLAVPTQTGLALALALNIAPPVHRSRLVADLKVRLDKRKIHLDTGFVGTYFLCAALAENGLADYAYTLLFNEDFPSWLYEVNLGATTIWERWNSVLPDGRVSDTGMNSLNHYAYGAIVEWMYRYMAGIQPVESAPGFKRMRIHPLTDPRLTHVQAAYDAAAGLIRSGWQRTEGDVRYNVKIPFDCEAEFQLAGPVKTAAINGAPSDALARGETVLLAAGLHEIVAVG